MKIKSLFLLMATVFSLNGYGQIDTIHFYGVKYYTEGNMIAYFYLNGIDCKKQSDFISEQMKQVSIVNRFVINYQNNHYWCMLDASKTISEDEIQDLINNFIIDFGYQCNEIPSTCKKIILPEDFPKYIDTGNIEQDRENYQRAKDKWIADHPEEYKKLNNRSNVSPELMQKKIEEKSLKN